MNKTDGLGSEIQKFRKAGNPTGNWKLEPIRTGTGGTGTGTGTGGTGTRTRTEPLEPELQESLRN